MFKRIILVVILLSFLYPILFPHSSYGWPTAVIKYTIQDSIALLPEKMKSTLFPHSSYMIDQLSNMKSKSHGYDPNEHRIRIIEMIPTRKQRDLQLVRELAKLTLPLIKAYQPASFSKYLSDLVFSPSLFVVHFDGYQKIESYEEYLNKIRERIEKIRFSRTGYRKKKSQIAKITHSIYNDMVNDVVDLWTDIWQEAGQEISHLTQTGKKRSRKINRLLHQPLKIEEIGPQSPSKTSAGASKSPSPVSPAGTKITSYRDYDPQSYNIINKKDDKKKAAKKGKGNRKPKIEVSSEELEEERRLDRGRVRIRSTDNSSGSQ